MAEADNEGLAGRTALVTGAGRGIGRAVAQRLARDGARVAVHYGTSADEANDVVRGIIASGGDAFAIQATLGVPGDARRLWEEFDRHSDHVDIVVNNAGTLGDRTPFAEASEATYNDVFAVNARAPFFILQQALDRIADGGRIVNVSTKFTHGARVPELMAYSMSKAALDALTATLAKAVGSRGITVNAVGPGATNTDMNRTRFADPETRRAIARLSPLDRAAEPEDVADIVRFLCSHDARWITGQWLDASGGSML